MKHLLLLGLLAAPAQATTVHFFNDPEPMTFTIVDGMPSFRKVGIYTGGLKGDRRCVIIDRPQNMALYRDCVRTPSAPRYDLTDPRHWSPCCKGPDWAYRKDVPLLPRTVRSSGVGDYFSPPRTYSSSWSESRTVWKTINDRYPTGEVVTVVPAPAPALVPVPISLHLFAVSMIVFCAIKWRSLKDRANVRKATG